MYRTTSTGCFGPPEMLSCGVFYKLFDLLENMTKENDSSKCKLEAKLRVSSKMNL